MDLTQGFTDCFGCSPVLFALACRQWDIASILLENGGSAGGKSCESLSNPGWSALHYCVCHGKLELFNQIIRQEPTALDYGHPIPLLHVTALHSQFEILNVLLTGSIAMVEPYPVDIRTERGLFRSHSVPSRGAGRGATALHLVSHAGNARAAIILLEHGARVNNTDYEGSTPLHSAVRGGKLAATTQLVSRGAFINAQDHWMWTSVMVAASLGYYDHVELLANCGANLRLYDTYGQQASHIAATGGHAQVAAYLWWCGLALDTVDSKGNDVCLLGFASREPAIRTFLLNCGTDISCCSPIHGNVLHEFLRGPELCLPLLKAVLRKLKACGALQIINHKPTYDVSLLYLATARNQISVLQALLDAGANVDAEGGPEGTALMCAAGAGRLEAVRLLVNAGADVAYQKKSRILSAVAVARDHPKVLQWLLIDRFEERRLTSI
ncbi:ankyrin [Viridothelium virens]|uniref:Ankyrin n=1 Tax=Viridothelium virens TaxID=1048519 RepID=A0A6A6HB26_VIRVR|nr:ankyrin [Viridothelium virens]